MQHPHNRHELETLETRLMFSADPLVVVAEEPVADWAAHPAVVESFTMESGEATATGGREGGWDLFDDAPELAETPQPVSAGAAQYANVTVPPVPRPMLILPGIAGTFAAPGSEEIWYTQRGIGPEHLAIDPLAGYYDDILATLQNAAGYRLGDNLFAATYDWRMAPGPEPTGPYDGTVDGLTMANLTDDVFAYSVDYLGHWLKTAASRWLELYGQLPESVDIVAHSTGGLVARTYIQSSAYNFDPTDLLPAVHNLIMAGVPNRGAPKAWNPLQNNFSADPAYKIVLSKVIDKAYQLYLAGETIAGADGDIKLANPASPLSETDFILAYVPTIRALLSTEAFLYPEGGDTPATANGDPLKNSWILDLNDGLDSDFSLAQYEAAQAGDNDPNAFADRLTGTAMVVYSTGGFVTPQGYDKEVPDDLETVVKTYAFTGPQAPDDVVTYFNEFYGHNPQPGEVWYRDVAEPTTGDGTVPTSSALSQFANDLRFLKIHVNQPHLDKDGEIDTASISHTGLMANRQMQLAMLNLLGVTFDAAKISTTLAKEIHETLIATLGLQILDPAELLAQVNWTEAATFGVNQTIRTGLGFVSGWAADLDKRVYQNIENGGSQLAGPNPLQWPVPFTGMSLADLLSFERVFNTHIALPLVDFLENNPNGNTGDLVQYIKDWTEDNITLPDGSRTVFRVIGDGVRGGLLALTDPRLQELLALDPADAGQLREIVFHVPFEYSRTSEAPADLGTFAAMQGFEIDSAAAIEFTAGLQGTLVFGVDLRAGVPTNQRFFVRLTDFAVEAAANVADLDAAINVGALGAGVVDGTVAATAGLRFGFDPAIRNARMAVTQQQLQAATGKWDGFMALTPAFEPYATLDATLPLAVSYAGLNGMLNPRITISGSDLFDERPAVALDGFGDLEDFTSMSAGSLEDILQNIVVVFEKLKEAPELLASLPFAGSLPLNQIADLARFLDEALVDSLRDADGALTFRNLQEFITIADNSMNPPGALSLGGHGGARNVSVGGVYDSASSRLSFSFAYDFGFNASEQSFNFAYDLGALEIFTNGGTFTLAGDGTFSFDIVIDLAKPSAAVTGDAPLPADGVLAQPVQLEILLDGGLLSAGNAVILPIAADPGNLGPADLVADVNAAIAASQLAGLVQARLDGGRLVIETLSRGPTPSLLVKGGDALGITGIAFNAHQPSAQALLNDLSVEFQAQLVAPKFTAGARIGYAGIFINEGSANLGMDFALDLTPGGPVAVRDLFLSLAADPAALAPVIAVNSSGFIRLGGIDVDGGLLAGPGPGAAIEIRLGAGFSFPVMAADPAMFEVTFVGDFSSLLKFENLDFAAMVQLLRDSLAIIGDIAQNDFLNRDLPLVGGSVNDLLGALQAFSDFIDNLEQSAPATLQAFAALLSDNLQDLLDAAFPGQGLEADAAITFGSDNILRLDFAFLAALQARQRLALDPLGAIPGLGAIVDLQGSSMLETSLAAWLRFAMGIDLSNPAAPNALLFQGTEAAFEILLAAESINFAAAAPLGFFVRNGTAHIDDGTAQRGPARAAFAFTPASGDRMALAGVGLANFTFSLVGEARASLPVRFPLDTPGSELATPIAFHVDFTDFAGATFSGPDFEELFANVNLFDFLSDGLDLLFFAVEELADGRIFSFEIPFIGDQLAELATFFSDLREEMRAAFDGAQAFTEQAVADLLYSAIGPDGIGFLLPISGSGLPAGPAAVSAGDVRVDLAGDGPLVDSIEIEMRLGQFIQLLDAGFGFADGLPGLNLDIDAQLQIELAWEWRLIFGVTRADGFYLETLPGDDLKLQIDATLPNASLGGTFGFLGLQAQQRPGGQPSGLSLGAAVDINPDGGLLTLGELADQGFSSFEVELNGSAVLDMVFTLGFATLSGNPVDALPSFLVDFLFEWDFLDASTSSGVLGNTPVVRFNNIRLDVGTFFGDFLRPIVNTINAYLKPMEPVIDFLDTNLAMLNFGPLGDFFDKNNDGRVTILDVAAKFGTVSDTAYDFISAALMIRSLVMDLASGGLPGRGSGVTISLGSFDFGAVDLRAGELETLDPLAGGVFSGPAKTVEEAFASLSNSKARTLFSKTQQTASDGSGGFKFELFKAENLVKLLMGQPVTFFTYQMPEISFDYAQSFRFPVWTPPTVSVFFGAAGGFKANLTFGYDSSGIAAYLAEDGEISDLFGGFYIAVGTSVPPQLTLYGRIFGGASVDVVAVSASVEIGVGMVANFRLVDPGDGKLYFWQISSLVKQRGLLEAIECLFIIDGEVYGYASIDISVFLIGTVFEMEIARITFFEFTTGEDDDCFSNLIPDRLEQYEERIPNNNTRSFAADLGVAPGIHLRGASISSPGDVDYYSFELLKPDDLKITLNGHKDFEITLYNAEGQIVAAMAAGNQRKRINTGTLPAGVYFLKIGSAKDETYAAYELDVTPGSSSATRVLYVNSPGALPPDVHSFYTLAPGSDAHADAGLHPDRPAATLNRVHELHTLAPDDLVVFDTGVYTNGFAVTGGSGFMAAGAPRQRFMELPAAVTFGTVLESDNAAPAALVETVDGVTMAKFRIENSQTGLRVSQAGGFHGVQLSFAANQTGADIAGSSDPLLERLSVRGVDGQFTGIQVATTGGLRIVDSTISTIGTGISLTDTTDASLERITSGNVDNVVVVIGGSGFSLAGSEFEGALKTTLANGVPSYAGTGVTAVSISGHTAPEISNLQLARFTNGVTIVSSSTIGITGLTTLKTGVGLGGSAWDGASVAASQLRGSSFALNVNGAAGPNAGLLFTGLQIGLPEPDGTQSLPQGSKAQVTHTDGLEMANATLHGTFAVSLSSNVNFHGGQVTSGGVSLVDSTGVEVRGNTIGAGPGASAYGLHFERTSGGVVRDNLVGGPGGGMRFVSSASLEAFNNTLTGVPTGIHVSGTQGSASAGLSIHDNLLAGGTTGIHIANTFVDGITVTGNTVSNFTARGIHAVGYAALVGNDVSGSQEGIRFEPDAYGLWENRVHDNTVGLTGGGYLGNDDRSATRHNLVYSNQTGIVAEGGNQQVAFNKVYGNGTGIRVKGAATLHHNVVYRNTGTGVLVDGANGAQLWNNTIYSTGDHAIRVAQTSRNTDLRNNIAWSVGGTVVHVDFPGGDGLTSDYNNYYASGGAVLFSWIKDFDDLLDWQIELGLDLNSIGTTRIDPALDQPAFINLAGDDYRIADVTSTTINAGDPGFTFGNEPGPGGGPNGLRINLGAYGDTAEAALSPASYIRVLSPNYYLDYTRERSRRIVWESFNVAGNVTLELHRQSTGKLLDMTVLAVNHVPDQVFDQPASHGSYFWSPQMSAVDGDDAARYFIRVVSANNSSVNDQNREPFAIPVTSNQFHVNDGSTSGDSLTTAAGDNRNTGKLPGTPKAILPAVLQNYALSANQTVAVDAGSYLHLRDIYISSSDAGGNNEAFVLTGPQGGGAAVFNRADPRAGAVGILLDDASFVTIRNLTLTGGHTGIEARNTSTFLALQNLVLDGHAGPQVRIHGGSDRAALAGLRVTNGGQDGIVVDALLQSIADTLVAGHAGKGLSLLDTGNGTLTGNVIEDNLGGGLYVYNNVAATTTVVGSADLASGVGNIVRDNGGNQVEVRGNVLVAGNAVYQTDGGPRDGTGTGIYLWSETARHNVVAGHATGIFSRTGATIDANRIYNNSQYGVRLVGTNVQYVTRNVIYSNPTGIYLTRSPAGSASTGVVISNNVFYDAATAAASLATSNGFDFINNTVLAGSENGLVVRTSSSGTIRNNIFSMSGGIAVNLDLGSQTNLDSDYNLFHIAGGGSVGTWVGANRASLQDWRNAAFLDRNSLAADPLFVDPDGADNQLGYQSPAQDGRDDNLHLQSIAGSVRNGSLAPVLDAGTGLPVWLTPAFVADASQSPAIDRGDGASAFANESGPNGNFINIGAFGNTPLASRSPVEYVLVMSPAGGETWPIGQSFEIRWRSQDFLGSADIALRRDGQPDPVAVIASGTENDGSYLWTLTEALTPGAGYRIEVTRGGTQVAGRSLSPFSISEPIQFYYVNDDTVEAGGFATAPGDNANDGLGPATPKASIRAILEAYDLGVGDVILVDAGTYILTTNITIGGEDSGVTIRGFHDPARPELVTLIDRNNRSSGAYAFELAGTTDISFERVTMVNAYRAIQAGNGGAVNLTVRDSVFRNNENAGIYVDRNNPGLLVEGSVFQGSGVTSNGQGRQDYGIDYAATHAVIRGNTFTSNHSHAVYIESPSSTAAMEYVIEENTISGGQYGIRSNASVNDALVRANTVSGTSQRGIDIAGSRSVASANILYNNNIAIEVTNYATASGNVEVYDNSIGIYATNNARVVGNTVRNNTEGIRSAGTTSLIKGNTVHENATGIRFDAGAVVAANIVRDNQRGLFADGLLISSNGQWRASLYNNVVYGNSEYALKVERAIGSPRVFNNTFVQSGGTGTAVILVNAPNLDFRNNIVAVDGAPGLNISADSQPGFSADYNVYSFTGGASWFLWGTLALDSRADWFYNVGQDRHARFADPLFADAAGGDYHLLPGSPAIDAGDPASAYALEPEPSGGRVNAGAYGNTPQAAVSPASGIHLLEPAGLDKLLQNSPTGVRFLASGLLDRQIVGSYNAGTAHIDGWAPLANLSGASTVNTTQAIDLGAASHPAPESVYRQYLRSGFGAGNRIELGLELSPGDYVLRLHFIQDNTANYLFDILFNDVLQVDDFSIMALAGKAYTAVVHEVPVTVGPDGRANLSLVVQTGYAHISGVEAMRVYPDRAADPRFTVELSRDSGAAFATLQGGVALDPRGYGRIDWTPLLPTQGRTALLRVTSETPQPVSGSSETFLIANDGNQYYVNDSSLLNDVYTTAVGDNLNTGKDPGSPLPSLEALLTVYSPSAGDIVYVDSGTYVLTRDITLGAGESGITIRGAFDAGNPGAVTVLDRANRASPNDAFELAGASDLTLEHLTITNAFRGINAGDAGAVNLTVRNSRFVLNEDAGIRLAANNTGVVIENNTFEGSGTNGTGQGRQVYGIYYDATGIVIRGNTIVNAWNAGIYLDSPSASAQMSYLVEDNVVAGARLYGIQTTSRVNDALIRNNTVSGSTQRGIDAYGSRTLVTGTTAFDNVFGIEVSGGATATGNIQVYNNTVGLYATSNAFIIANTAFDNTEGIRAAGSASVVEGNTVHGNGTGIRFDYLNLIIGNTVYNNQRGLFADGLLLGSNTQWRASLHNNLVYGNSEYALKIERAVGRPRVFNNTFVQAGASGTAVILVNAPNLDFRNNIVATDAGTGLSVSIDSQPGFTSDYNLYWLTGGATPFRWDERVFDTHADWFYNTGADRHARFANPLFAGAATGNYRLRAGSPGIDAGDPAYPYDREPAPAGGRANVGAYANTALAASGPAQGVTVLNPTGLDKFSQGRPVTIDFLATGYRDYQSIAWFNAGSAILDGWRPLDGVTGGTVVNNSTTVDLSLLDEAPGADIFRDFLRSASGAGKRIDISLDLPPGDYRFRLYFMTDSTSNYNFNIEVDGNVVRQDYSILNAAGARHKAVVEEVPVTVDADGNVILSLVVNNFYAVLSGLEILRANASGTPDPRFDVDVSYNGGLTFAPVASNVPVNGRGAGSLQWTPSASTDGRQAVVRVTAAGQPAGAQSAAFMVANDGNRFYVNDGSLDNDSFTTAAGDNLNSGKSPDSPMASLEALLGVYDLRPGDVVHVDAGTYLMTRNILLTDGESGIRIIGAREAGNPAALTVLDRGYSQSPFYAFHLDGVTGLTLEDLRITGAYRGIHASDNSATGDITLRGMELVLNRNAGLYTGTNSGQFTILDSRFEGTGAANQAGSQEYGVYARTPAIIVQDSVFTGNYRWGLYLDSSSAGTVRVEDSRFEGSLAGMESRANGTVVLRSTFANNVNTGLYISGSASVVRESVAYGTANSNRTAGEGFYITGGAVAEGNTAYDNWRGFEINTNSFARGNVAFENTRGIFLWSATATGNRVYGNELYGIGAYQSSIISGNQVYANDVGIQGFRQSSVSFTGRITDNLVYNNGSAGIKVEYGAGALRIVNNTVYHPVGDALNLANVSGGRIHNNILWVDAGFAINADAASVAAAVLSDYNLFFLSEDPNARIGQIGTTFVDTLAGWQAQTGKDAGSLFGDPRFFDRDGADDVGGYRDISGILVDGGEDDNFHLLKFSPAIDRGVTWWGTSSDLEGDLRRDDPGTPDAGGVRYAFEILPDSEFDAARGTGQGWQINQGRFTLALPFSFTFYGQSYTELQVGTSGLIGFPSLDTTTTANTLSRFVSRVLLAPFWGNIDTNRTERDIYVDTSVAGEVYIRWDARSVATGSDVRFAVLLREDGSIRFDYGEGNLGIQPTVGLSAGDSVNYFLVDGYNGSSGLSGAASVAISLQPGIVDIGAYEFKGNSLDNQPPVTVTTLPQEIDNQVEYFGFLGEILVQLSESIDTIDFLSPATYELIRDADGNGQFTDSDEFYDLSPVIEPGANTVRLLIGGGALVDGDYRFRIKAGNLRDVSGNLLDGDGSGAAGGDYLRAFSVRQPVLPVFTNAAGAQGIRGESFAFLLAATNGPVTFAAQGLPAGLILDPQTGLISGIPEAAGSFDVLVTATNSDGAVDADLLITVLAAPQVTGVVVNDGGAQRSMVSRIEIGFDQDVAASLQLADILVVNQDSGAAVAAGLIQLSWSFVSRSAVLTFPASAGGSLPDGNYVLTIAAAGVEANGLVLDGDADGVRGGDFVFTLHRLLGDSTGNRAVDTLDGYHFRKAYGSSLGDASYRADLDFNRDGAINQADRSLFEDNFRSTLAEAVPQTEPLAATAPASVSLAPAGKFLLQAGAQPDAAVMRPTVPLLPAISVVAVYSGDEELSLFTLYTTGESGPSPDNAQ